MTAHDVPPAFSPGDAALEGFRLTREHPQVIPIIAVLQFAVSLLVSWALVSSGYVAAAMTMVETMQKSGTPDTAVVAAAIPALMSKMLLALPAALVVDALVRTAVARMVLRPEDKGFLYFKLSADELRVLGLRLLIAVIMMALGMVGGGVMGLILAVGGPIGALFVVVLFFALVWLAIAIQIRLSLAAPSTFYRHRISLSESLALTKGRSWPLFGCYVIAVILFMVVLLAGSLIVAAITAIGGAGVPNMTNFAAYLTPIQLVGDAVSALFSALGLMILYAPGMVIYRRLAGADAARMADTF